MGHYQRVGKGLEQHAVGAYNRVPDRKSFDRQVNSPREEGSPRWTQTGQRGMSVQPPRSWSTTARESQYAKVSPQKPKTDPQDMSDRRETERQATGRPVSSTRFDRPQPSGGSRKTRHGFRSTSSTRLTGVRERREDPRFPDGEERDKVRALTKDVIMEPPQYLESTAQRDSQRESYSLPITHQAASWDLATGKSRSGPAPATGPRGDTATCPGIRTLRV